jgi:glycerol-3-phosphate dehydrogenase
MVGGTRGAHLVVRFPGGGPRHAIYAEAAVDHRPFFVVPWRGVHLVGTTDIRVSDPDAVLPSDGEVEYLYEATSRLIPGETLRAEDIWYAYGGIRPLPYSVDEREGAITRRHHIVDHRADGAAGLITVVGGKLSTYRRLSVEVVDILAERLGNGKASRTSQDPLVLGEWQPNRDSSKAEWRLWRIYGPRAAAVLATQHRDPLLTQPLCPHTVETLAEASHAIRYEGAVTVADVLLRRTPAGWSRCRGLDAAPKVAALMIGATESAGTDIDRMVADYDHEVRRTFRTYP